MSSPTVPRNELSFLDKVGKLVRAYLIPSVFVGEKAFDFPYQFDVTELENGDQMRITVPGPIKRELMDGADKHELALNGEQVAKWWNQLKSNEWPKEIAVPAPISKDIAKGAFAVINHLLPDGKLNSSTKFRVMVTVERYHWEGEEWVHDAELKKAGVKLG